MSEVTAILLQVENGDRHAAEKLLPLVYEELRRLAAQRLSQEKPGQTLQATALVHEAYLRLVGGDPTDAGDAMPGQLGGSPGADRIERTKGRPTVTGPLQIFNRLLGIGPTLYDDILQVTAERRFNRPFQLGWYRDQAR